MIVNFETYQNNCTVMGSSRLTVKLFLIAAHEEVTKELKIPSLQI